jgi:hypothetical protein
MTSATSRATAHSLGLLQWLEKQDCQMKDITSLKFAVSREVLEEKGISFLGCVGEQQ